MKFVGTITAWLIFCVTLAIVLRACGSTRMVILSDSIPCRLHTAESRPQAKLFRNRSEPHLKWEQDNDYPKMDPPRNDRYRRVHSVWRTAVAGSTGECSASNRA